MLELRELSCERGERILFSGLNFKLQEGELAQVTGANGAGKTTLLRLIVGLLPLGAGVIYWRGRELDSALRPEFASELAYLGHKLGGSGLLTPLEQLHIARRINKSDPLLSDKSALERVGLGRFAHSYCGNLSAGQNRRVALARLLIAGAKLWILDEPLTALDREGIELVEQMLLQHLQRGGLALVATHQPLRLDSRLIRELPL